MTIISSPCTRITAQWCIKVCSQARNEANESIQSDGFLLHRSLSEPDAWRTCKVRFPGHKVLRVCVCVCLSLSVFLCACTHAYARLTSLQMSSGRAKCPLDDTLPVRVCLRTHLATIICSSGARVKNGVTHGRNAAVGWFVGSVLQILLFTVFWFKQKLLVGNVNIEDLGVLYGAQ